MKLMVQSYNNGGAAYNAEAEETKLRTYTMDHEFNKPAKCNITLADVDGSIMKKYNVDANDVYLGVGKVFLEDPTGTDLFQGRIVKAVGNSNNKTVTLECRDWLDQLDEEQVIYDMREKLGTTDLRQSNGRSDPDQTRFGEFLGVAGKLLYAAHSDDGGAFTDESFEANEDTTDDMTLMPAVPVDDDAYYFGFEVQSDAMVLNISQTGVGNWTMDWQYWDGGAWAALTKTDPTNAKWLFWVASGETAYAWTVPGDWATTAVNGVTAYYIRAVMNNFVAITTQPLGERCWSEYYFFDDGEYATAGGMAFANDQYNGMFLVFTTGMAGKKTWRFFPYQGTPSAGAAYDDNVGSVWSNTGLVDAGSDNVDWTLDYDFRIILGHNTPSDFYVHDSITGARVFARYQLAVVAGNHTHINIDDKTDGWFELETLEEDDHFIDKTWSLESGQYTDIIDSNGIATVRFDIDRTGGVAGLGISYLYVEVDTETTGYSSAITINDTINPNRLVVATDLTAAATHMWEYVPYCICQPIYTHFESATGVILGGDGIVTLTCGAANVEDTTGLSTRQYKEMTRLQVAQDLAIQDKSVFWITLGGTTVTYKQTFGADTMQLTDGKINEWTSYMDYNSMANEYHVYGARIGDYEIYQSSTDTTSETKFKATRTKVLRNAGLVSDADALAIGTALAARDANPLQIVGCTITGNTATAAHATTIKLGEIVEITSSYLWSTAAKDYIVTRWAYDSKAHETTLTMIPKGSIGIQELETAAVLSDKAIDGVRRGQTDKTITDPVTHEVS